MSISGTITGLQFCKDWLISCSEDGLVCVWDCRTWECIHVLSGHRSDDRDTKSDLCSNYIRVLYVCVYMYMYCTCVYTCTVRVCIHVLYVCVYMYCTCVYTCTVRVCIHVLYVCVYMYCTCVCTCTVHALYFIIRVMTNDEKTELPFDYSNDKIGSSEVT